MEELTLDSILSEEQINGLFNDNTQDTPPPEDNEEKEDKPNKEEKEIKTTEVNLNALFGDSPESVGSVEHTGEEDTDSTKSNTSPDFYSSIATALVEDGIFQNLDDTYLSKIKTAEDFAELISSQVKNQFDERQKRIDEALNVGIEPTDIQRYENYINVLNNISEEALSDEGDKGINLRKNIIYQDYINRGISEERAKKYVERSFSTGTDIEDAKEALQSNKEFFQSQYNDLIKEAKAKEEEERKQQKKQEEEFRTAILESDKAFGEIKLDKSTRQKVYDSIAKPVYTNPKTGERLTAIQKYEAENRTDFLKNVGLLYVLTDGFKNINKLVDDKVKKETKKSIRNLEHTLKSSSSNLGGGDLSYTSGSIDPESLFKGYKLSI